jgi:hypothetical protein
MHKKLTSSSYSQQAGYYMPPHIDVLEAPTKSAGNGAAADPKVIIIIGAGISGKSLAITLARHMHGHRHCKEVCVHRCMLNAHRVLIGISAGKRLSKAEISYFIILVI